jgi:uncharacterized membrane protein YedE/YeeE
MTNFTPFSALAGGALIGLASTVLWFGTGRIAGISGIFGDAILLYKDGRSTKIAFLLGLLASAGVFAALRPTSFTTPTRGIVALAVGGFLVGIGTRMGPGCTSGHGVCGLSRLSLRSLVATMTFMVVAAVTVFVVDHVMGAA